MTQFYIGTKQVEAWRENVGEGVDTREGYAVKYPNGYQSWCPKDVFEAAYIPMGTKTEEDDSSHYQVINHNSITDKMVRDFIVRYDVTTLGLKTTVVRATLRNGFEVVESSSCVDASNYSEQLGAKICKERIVNQVWHLLGFALQWAISGLSEAAKCD